MQLIYSGGSFEALEAAYRSAPSGELRRIVSTGRDGPGVRGWVKHRLKPGVMVWWLQETRTTRIIRRSRLLMATELGGAPQEIRLHVVGPGSRVFRPRLIEVLAVEPQGGEK